MSLRLRMTPTLGASVLALGAAGQVAYPIGFAWNRAADWTSRPLADQGSTRGNPDDDATGTPAWSYEYLEIGSDIGGVGSAFPWYEQAHVASITRMVWDGRYQDSPLEAWARAEDSGPFITRAGLFHVLQPVTRQMVPLSRLGYSGRCRATVRIQGDLTVIWTGIAPMSNQSPDDVALVVWRAGGGTEPLVLRHLDRPASNDTAVVHVDAVATLDPGDSLVLTHFGTTPDIRNWIYLGDALTVRVESSDVALTEPAARTVVGPRGTARIAVSAPGADRFRWFKDDRALSDGEQIGGAVISGSAAATLTIAGVTEADRGMYRCQVWGECGTRLSEGSALVLCAADATRDGVVDLLDFFEFLNCMDSGFPCADLDGDGQVVLEDFFAFFSAWDAGC